MIRGFWISVCASATRSGVSFGPPKSKRSRRSVALDAETVEALRIHHEAQLLERAFAGEAYVDHDLVFCGELGAPIHPQRLTERFGRYRNAAGLVDRRCTSSGTRTRRWR